MPTIFEWKGWKFLFYSLDMSEPPHVHIRKDRKELKVWLMTLTIAKNKRCNEQDVNSILATIRERQGEFLEKWHEHFGN